MPRYLLFVFTICSLSLSSQRLRGTLTDELGQPLSYVNVSVMRTQTGVFSDETGLYTIDTVGLVPTDEIVFSHLGYAELRLSISALMQRGTALTMQPRDYQMHEVVVSPRDAKAMLLDALDAMKDNYPDEFTKEEIIFKDYSMRNGHNSHYAYFHFDLYVPSYIRYDSLHTYTTVHDYALYERKKELFTAKMTPDMLLPYAFPTHRLNADWINRHEFTLAGTTPYQGDTLNVIRFKLKPMNSDEFIGATGLIYIDQKDKAIRYAQFDVANERAKRFYLVAKLDTAIIHVRVAYRKSEGKYILDYLTQSTYAVGKLFGTHQNLRYSTTMRGMESVGHLKANQIVMRNEVRDLIPTLKPKDIEEMKETPDMK